MGLGAEKDTDVVLHFNDPFDNPAIPLISGAQPGSLINNSLARNTPLKKGTKEWIGKGKPYWQNKRFSSENNADVWMNGENSQSNRMKTEAQKVENDRSEGDGPNPTWSETTVTTPDSAKQITKAMKDCTPITKMECSVNW